MTALAHYYHVYAAGDWERAVVEHVDALERSGLAAELAVLCVGIVGHPDDRAKVRDLFVRGWPDVAVVEADVAWEQLTLTRAWEDVGAGFDGHVLYAHTKGASAPSVFNDAWRASMTEACVVGWRSCVAILDRWGYETAGCHWLTPERYPGTVVMPFYGGNFWWARAEVLRRAGRPGLEDRHRAEAWLGMGHARAYDLAPGWPGWDTFVRPGAWDAELPR